jgi:hypothetical protein
MTSSVMPTKAKIEGYVRNPAVFTALDSAIQVDV